MELERSSEAQTVTGFFPRLKQLCKIPTTALVIVFVFNGIIGFSTNVISGFRKLEELSQASGIQSEEDAASSKMAFHFYLALLSFPFVASGIKTIIGEEIGVFKMFFGLLFLLSLAMTWLIDQSAVMCGVVASLLATSLLWFVLILPMRKFYRHGALPTKTKCFCISSFFTVVSTLELAMPIFLLPT